MEAQGPEPGYQNRIDGGLTGTLSRENLHERAHSALRDDKVWASVDSVGPLTSALFCMGNTGSSMAAQEEFKPEDKVDMVLDASQGGCTG